LWANNVTAGRAGRLYYNAAYDLWNGGDAHAVNTDTVADLGSFVCKDADGNIHEQNATFWAIHLLWQSWSNGGFRRIRRSDHSGDSIGYSPYPYGWDYDNYCLSGDDQHLAYGKILFNRQNFTIQDGQFLEQVYL